jgi:hypothetical protein
MGRFASFHRNWHVHSSHPTVGVGDARGLLAPPAPLGDFRGCPEDEDDGPLADETEPSAGRLVRIALVAPAPDRKALAAMRCFERIAGRQWGLACHCLEIGAAPGREAGRENCSGIDCLVVFAGGLHVLGDRSDLGDALAWGDRRRRGGRRVKLRVAASRPHPVVDGLRPFTAVCTIPTAAARPTAAAGPDDDCVLAGAADVVCPVAWAGRGRGRVFQAAFGSAADFQNPDFLELLQNALRWATGG